MIWGHWLLVLEQVLAMQSVVEQARFALAPAGQALQLGWAAAEQLLRRVVMLDMFMLIVLTLNNL